MMKNCSLASVSADALFLVNFFNKSTSKWLPRLRDVMVRLSSRKLWHALINGIITRWTSTWLSCCSVLAAKKAMKVVIIEWSVEVDAAVASNSGSKALVSLKRAAQIVRSDSFWARLGQFLEVLVPTIEPSLVLQGGDATLADVLHAKGRQLKTLIAAGENATVALLEKRWGIVEQPLPMISFFFHPKYRSCAISSDIPEHAVARLVLGYATRWGVFGALGIDPQRVSSLPSAVDFWVTSYEAWVKEAEAFQDPCRYWGYVARSCCGTAATSDISAGISVLAEVLIIVFTCSPNSADPERLFSELGRMITPSRTRLKDEKIVQNLVVSAAVRWRKQRAYQVNGFGSDTGKWKRFTDAAAAVLKLRVMDAGVGGAAAIVSSTTAAVVENEVVVVQQSAEGAADSVFNPVSAAASASGPGISEAPSQAAGSGSVEDDADCFCVEGDNIERAEDEEIRTTAYAVADFEKLLETHVEVAAEYGVLNDDDLF